MATQLFIFRYRIVFLVILQLLGLITFGQIIDVQLEGKPTCGSNVISLEIWLKESQFSDAPIDLSTSSFFFNFNPSQYEYVGYVPSELDGSASSAADAAGWADQVIKVINSRGLINLVLMREQLVSSSYKLDKFSPKRVGTLTFNRLTDAIIRKDFIQLDFDYTHFYGADNQVINSNISYGEICNDGNSCTLNDGLDIACNCTGTLNGSVDFANEFIKSFVGSQDFGSAEVQEEGAALKITDNAWKAIDFFYEITPNTLLEFEFKSDQEGEIHGIGLSNDLVFEPNRSFMLFGTQVASGIIDDFKNYSEDEYVSYAIPVGQYYMGAVSQLFFIMDHDEAPGNATSYFRNVRVYEPEDCREDNEAPSVPRDLIASHITKTSLDLSWTASTDNEAVIGYYVYQGDNSISVGMADGNSFAVNGLTPGNTYEFTIAAYDEVGNISEKSQAIQVTLPTSCETVNFASSGVSPHGGSQDQGQFEIQEGGAAMKMANNAWKSIPYTYNITSNTVLEFSFKTDILGEYHVIGMSNTTAWQPARAFKLAGTQAVPGDIDDFDTYMGIDYVSYSIPIGQYYTGLVDRIFFSSDHDADPGNATSYFRNVRVYEEGECDEEAPSAPQNLAAFNITTTSLNLSWTASMDNFSIAGYYVYQNGSNVPIATVNSTSYPVTGLAPGSTHQFSVAAFDEAGNVSAQSQAVQVTLLTSCDEVDFRTAAIISYWGAQDQGQFEVQEEGASIKIFNNAWKYTPFEYTISPNTLLEFEFKSDIQGEYHAIGMSNTNDGNLPKTFKLYGTQNNVGGDIDDYDTYSGTEYVSFVIPIGQYYTGEVDRIFFAADHDEEPGNATSYFRNVRVYEAGECEGGNENCTSPQNLAINKPSTQSSTYGAGLANYANDGNTAGSSPWAADLQHTQRETQPWWEVDLEAIGEIEQIKIYNRTDGSQQRLKDFYVLVSNAPFDPGASLADHLANGAITQNFFSGSAGAEEVIAVNTSGRYIRIQLSGSGILHMAEVEVSGCGGEEEPDPCTNGVSSNLALNQIAEQSSTYGNGVASLANDGNETGSSPWSADLAHTNRESQPWWQVDLGAVSNIEQVNIYNRTDCCAGRLNNFYILVSDTPFDPTASLDELRNDPNNYVHTFTGRAGLLENITIGTTGRYVRIQHTRTIQLHLAEVEVMGCAIGTQGNRLANANEVEAGENIEFDLRVFPNPSSGRITISIDQLAQGEPVEYSLYNLQGQRVWQTRGQRAEQVNLSHLAKGVYLLRAQGNGWNQVKQLMIH